MVRGAPKSRTDWIFGPPAAVTTAALALSMWGFAIDDAWIGIRYARHLALGHGYRFNASGAVTDGVTPLPWAYLLVPLAAAGSPDATALLERVKYMGLAAWLVAAAALGVAIGRAQASNWVKVAAVAVLAIDLPLAAHAVSGMETALATCLATFAAFALVTTPVRPRTAALLAGLASSLRPEMTPWALTVGLAAAWASERSPSNATPAAPAPTTPTTPTPATTTRRARVLAIGGATALAPFAACVLARLVFFGRPAPLAVLAKPSDPSRGLLYVGAASLAALAPILVVSPFALRRAPFAARALVIAGGVHLAAVALAGGDWMPYARLIVPIVPSFLLAFVMISPRAHPLASAARVACAMLLGVRLLLTAAPQGRAAGRDRAAMIATARVTLADARSIAALDVGWPTAITDATMLDLAGITDPEIAALPGGHTSKRVDAALLLARDPDVLLLYVEGGVDSARLESWRDARYSRAVEGRLAASDVVAHHFTPRAFLPLGSRGAGYLVLYRR